MSKVLAVGDIHTKSWIVYNVAKLINQYDHIVFLGDYCDDWNSGALSSVETIRSIRMLQSLYPDKVKAVIGNHDFAYLLSFDPRSSGYNRSTQLQIDSPENKEIKSWLQSLPVTIKIDGCTYSHAGVGEHWVETKDEKLLWQDYSPIWNRPDHTSYGPEPQVFGHTPQITCTEVERNIWCIDTFSTYRDGTPIGDQTILEVTDGKEFNIRELCPEVS